MLLLLFTYIFNYSVCIDKICVTVTPNMHNYCMLGVTLVLGGISRMVAATNSETLTKHYPVIGKYYPEMGKHYPVMGKHYPVMGKYYPENTHAVVPIVHFSWADLVRRPSKICATAVEDSCDGRRTKWVKLV